MVRKAGSIHRRPVRANARNSLAWVALKGRETKGVRSRRQEVTEAEEALLRAIGVRVAPWTPGLRPSHGQGLGAIQRAAETE